VRGRNVVSGQALAAAGDAVPAAVRTVAEAERVSLWTAVGAAADAVNVDAVVTQVLAARGTRAAVRHAGTLGECGCTSIRCVCSSMGE
jgi:hypothetical protein